MRSNCQLRKWQKINSQRHTQLLQDKARVCVLIRIAREVETTEYCRKSAARIQTKTKPGNEITSFCEEHTALLDRIMDVREYGNVWHGSPSHTGSLFGNKDTRST